MNKDKSNASVDEDDIDEDEELYELGILMAVLGDDDE